MSTQWRIASTADGLKPIGLDYTALQPVLRMCAVPRAQWAEIFESICVMEDEALHTMRTKR